MISRLGGENFRKNIRHSNRNHSEKAPGYDQPYEFNENSDVTLGSAEFSRNYANIWTEHRAFSFKISEIRSGDTLLAVIGGNFKESNKRPGLGER